MIFNVATARRTRLDKPLLCCWLSVLSLLAAAGCSQSTSVATEEAPEVEPARLRVTLAELHSWPRTVRVQGSLMGDEQAIVGTKVAGRVREVAVDMGTKVQQGDLLASLESEEFVLKVKQAEAEVAQVRALLGLRKGDSQEQLDPQKAPTVLQEQALTEQAKSNMLRSEVLLEQDAITKEEYQQTAAMLRVAEARLVAALHGVDRQIALLGVRRFELELARQHLADTEIKSPFSGIIASRHVAPGVYLHVGERVATVIRTDPLRFRAAVPEREALGVQLGQDVYVRVEGLQSPLQGEIKRISPMLDLASRSLVLEVDLPNPDLRLPAGLFAEARIVIDATARVLALPSEAVTEFAGVEKVWLVTDGIAKEQRIVTGERNGEWTEIAEGLVVGDQVVADAQSGRAGPVIAVSDSPSLSSTSGGGDDAAQ